MAPRAVARHFPVAVPGQASPPVVRRWMLVLLGALWSVLLAKFFVADIETVPSFSMSPSVKSGDKVLVWKLFSRSNLRTGEMVVAESGGQRWCKRIVGVAGDVVQEKITISPGHIYLAGDNRATSEDLGEVSLSAIRGLVVGVIYSRAPRQYRQFDAAGGTEAKLYDTGSARASTAGPLPPQTPSAVVIEGQKILVLRVDHNTGRSLNFLAVEGDGQAFYRPGRYIWFDNACRKDNGMQTTVRGLVRIGRSGIEVDRDSGKSFTDVFPDSMAPITTAGDPWPDPIFLVEGPLSPSLVERLKTLDLGKLYKETAARQ